MIPLTTRLFSHWSIPLKGALGKNLIFGEFNKEGVLKKWQVGEYS
jgi:hypothetical protein